MVEVRNSELELARLRWVGRGRPIVPSPPVESCGSGFTVVRTGCANDSRPWGVATPAMGSRA